MLDLKKIRQNSAEAERLFALRGVNINVETLMKLDTDRRTLLSEVEVKKNERNQLMKELGIAKKKQNTVLAEQLTNDTRVLSNQINTIDADIEKLSVELNEQLAALPNLPRDEMFIGSNNGNTRIFDWDPKNHLEIGADLNLLKVSSGNIVWKNAGAALLRALIDAAMKHFKNSGITEVVLPYSTFSTHVSALYQNEIFENPSLPVSHVSYLQASGESKQFLQLCTLYAAENETQVKASVFDTIIRYLQLLELPYQIVQRAANALPFESAQTYDIQIWMPAGTRYETVASCHFCDDFISRETATRCRKHAKEKPQPVYTLHSVVELNKLMFALLENHQLDDGNVALPAHLAECCDMSVIGKQFSV